MKLLKHAEKLGSYSPLMTGLRSSGDADANKKLDAIDAEVEKCDKLWEME